MLRIVLCFLLIISSSIMMAQSSPSIDSSKLKLKVDSIMNRPFVEKGLNYKNQYKHQLGFFCIWEDKLGKKVKSNLNLGLDGTK